MFRDMLRIPQIMVVKSRIDLCSLDYKSRILFLTASVFLLSATHIAYKSMINVFMTFGQNVIKLF